MNVTQFQHWLAQLASLTTEQQAQLQSRLSAPAPLDPQAQYVSALSVQCDTALGLKRWTTTLSLPGVRQNLQPPDRNADGPVEKALSVAGLC